MGSVQVEKCKYNIEKDTNLRGLNKPPKYVQVYCFLDTRAYQVCHKEENAIRKFAAGPAAATIARAYTDLVKLRGLTGTGLPKPNIQGFNKISKVWNYDSANRINVFKG